MRLSAEHLRAALRYFDDDRVRVRLFASDTDFEALCRFEDEGTHRFSIAIDDPVVKIDPDPRGTARRALSRPRMIDDAAVHARASRAAELLMGSAWRPVALLVKKDAMMRDHGFLIELDHAGVWRRYLGGLERWATSHLTPDLELFAAVKYNR